jgi:hypothetical protein
MFETYKKNHFTFPLLAQARGHRKKIGKKVKRKGKFFPVIK